MAKQADAGEDARQFGELFPAVYLRFHRRDGKHRELPTASRSVLHHLTLAGPLTIGEMVKHLSRAQSVVSEIVDHLERDGLLERRPDPKDKRKKLVWLSDRGLALLDHEREVLSRTLLTRAMTRMRPADRVALLRGMHALLTADRPNPDTRRNP